MKAYKGFNADMTCRGFQYKEGENYTTEDAKVCECGFHACEYPLDCLSYYDPSTSVYHEVDLGGKIDRESDDTKVAATEIKIGSRLSIADLVKAAIDFTMAHIRPEAKADEKYGAASATGWRGECHGMARRGLGWTRDCGGSGVGGQRASERRPRQSHRPRRLARGQEWGVRSARREVRQDRRK